MLRSTVGRKLVMAVTGLLLLGFVVVHMLGNLKVWQGAAPYDAYARHLREFGAPMLGHGQFLWIARLVLLAAVALHVAAAVSLSRRQQACRPVPYAVVAPEASTFASRSMIRTGLVILLFVVYHVLHLTLGCVGFDAGAFREGEVFCNVVRGFSVWYVSAVYILAMAALGLHLLHGIWSVFQTLGLNASRRDRCFRVVAAGLTAVVVLGNISIPAGVLLGLIGR